MTTSLLNIVPARYAKFITSLAGLLVVYLQMYGATWHLVPAVTAIGAALGVLGVPNASQVAAVPAVQPPPAPRLPLGPPAQYPPQQGRPTA